MQILEVHGITVVSKYSRSKTFDDDPSVMRTLKEQHGFVHENEADVVGWNFEFLNFIKNKNFRLD